MFTTPTFRLRRLLPSVYWVSFVDFVVALGLITSLWFFPSGRPALVFLAEVLLVLNILGGLGWYWLSQTAGKPKPKGRPRLKRFVQAASSSTTDAGGELTGAGPTPGRAESLLARGSTCRGKTKTAEGPSHCKRW